MLQYTSAFDDEIQEVHEEQVEEMTAPKGAEAMPTGPDVNQPVEETSKSGQNKAGLSQNSHHGPYYYFYQGVCM